MLPALLELGCVYLEPCSVHIHYGELSVGSLRNLNGVGTIMHDGMFPSSDRSNLFRIEDCRGVSEPSFQVMTYLGGLIADDGHDAFLYNLLGNPRKSLIKVS